AVAPIEIRIDDVLVFLGRVLGILDGAVGPMLEPVRVLAQPGMIERALGGEIERHLEPMLPTGRHETAEIGGGAEPGMPRVMAALRGTDRIETAGVVGASLERVIASLAIGVADRMDRGEVDDVEAETGNVWQPRNAIVERAMPAGKAPLT